MNDLVKRARKIAAMAGVSICVELADRLEAAEGVVEAAQETIDVFSLGSLEGAAKYGPGYDQRSAEADVLTKLYAVLADHDKETGAREPLPDE